MEVLSVIERLLYDKGAHWTLYIIKVHYRPICLLQREESVQEYVFYKKQNFVIISIEYNSILWKSPLV